MPRAPYAGGMKTTTMLSAPLTPEQIWAIPLRVRVAAREIFESERGRVTYAIALARALGEDRIARRRAR